MSFLISSSVRMIALQFSFSNPDVVPEAVKELPAETQEERVTRKSRATGTLVVEPVHNVSIFDFLGDLDTAGYQLVDALYKERIDDHDRSFYMTRFIFVRQEHVQMSPEFQRQQAAVYAALHSIVLAAMWRVRVFNNPFYQKGEEVPGVRMLSINMEGRSPLFQPDGQPILVCAKDPATGRKIRPAQPIKASKRLAIIDNSVSVVDA